MLRPEQMAVFAEFIESKLGIIYSADNSFQLQMRLTEIADELGMNGDTEKLYRRAQAGIDGELARSLINRCANHETSFFRDPNVFTTIAKVIFPELVTRQEPIRIWSAASSFGQEPYSLAILLRELTAAASNVRWEILATDVLEVPVRRTREGTYSQLEIQRGLTAQRLVTNFQKLNEETWQVLPELQEHLTVQQQNLLDPFEKLGKFHLILCRNALIYQSVERKREIVERLRQQLAPGGYLILGAGESLLGISESFAQISTEKCVFYRRKDDGR